MFIERRCAAAVTGLLCGAALTYTVMASGGAGGRTPNRGGGGGGGGRNQSVGAMRPSAPAGGGMARANFNNSASAMPRAGMTGMQNRAARPNVAASRPDLGMGMRPAATPAGGGQNFAGARPAIATRPAFNTPASRPAFANAGMMNRPDLGGVNRPAGSVQPGVVRPAGLSPAIARPDAQGAGTNWASAAGSRPMFAGGRPSIAGANPNGNLAGLNQRPGSNIPLSRPDLGGRPNSGSTVLKPDITNPSILPGQVQRPDGGNRPGWADNRPGGDRPGGDNRPDRPDFNRPGDGNRPDWAGIRPGGNRPGSDWWSQWHGGGGNRPNWPNNRPNWNSNNNTWINNNRWTSNHQNFINNSPTIINSGYRPGFAVPGYGYGYRGNWGYGQAGVYDNSWQCGPGWAPAYGALHDDWCHGSWNGYGGNSNWLNYAAGATTGWLSSWAFGSRPYSWGYSSYSNPYSSSVTQTVVGPFDYSQPINTEVPPPAQDQTQTATVTLDQARQAFQDGNYTGALGLANQVVASLPNDPTVHQFRALALFALGKYDEASQALYPVLSVGPGWDWTTMAGLYPSEQTYQQQLTALENYVQGHPNEAAPHFLLAYHYLTLGSNDGAAAQLRQVVQLKPTDNLSRQMLSLLDSAEQQSAVAEQTPAQASAPRATPPQPETQTAEAGSPAAAPATIRPSDIAGQWTAKADDKTSIKLTLQPDGKFVWDVDQQGRPNQLRGNFTIGDGDLLTLAQDQQGGALAGNIARAQNGGFTFRLVGAPASDPGLTFVRQL